MCNSAMFELRNSITGLMELYTHILNIFYGLLLRDKQYYFRSYLCKILKYCTKIQANTTGSIDYISERLNEV